MQTTRPMRNALERTPQPSSNLSRSKQFSTTAQPLGLWTLRALFTVLTMALAAATAHAAGSETPELAGTASTKLTLTQLEDGSLDTTPILFPATDAGWPGELRQAWDVAPYLAHHKAAAMAQLATVEGMRAEQSPNQALYDVLTYDLVFDIDPVGRVVTGTTTMTAKVLSGPLSIMDVDLHNNLSVSSITSGGSPVFHNHLGGMLNINLDRAYNVDEVVTLVIDYSGTPPGGSAFFFDSADGETLIWTLSQPYGARTWWPCKDYPYDKAESADVRVTVPTGLVIASNGKLIEETDNGTSSFAHWSIDYPISSYLISLAIHPYVITTDTYTPASPAAGGPTDMPLVFYNYAADVGQNTPVQNLVDDMLAAFADRYGEYPFLDEKYGHGQCNFGGGMEHQTCTSIGFYGESIVAHEAAHQWYGDMVTCATYNHIWLNEGFATYGEALWAETAYGTAAYFQDILSNQYFGPGTIYVPDVNDEGRIFNSSLSYNKASWVLHMLRHVMGDTDFFQAMQDYASLYAYDAATTEQFRDVCEGVSGLDLDAYFQQWIYGEYFPMYEYGWTSEPADGGGFDITLNVDQIQSTGLFAMPIDVTITTGRAEETIVIQNSLATEQYVLHVDEEPVDVQLDKDHWILRLILAPIPEPTFEESTLLVNGVDWNTYGAEIYNAYEAEAFWGQFDIDFWDWFDEPVGGYPSTLPPARGHGAVPGDILGEYKNVIWVGNNFNGDIAGWIDTPIYAYLNAGGNVLLLTRMGEDFVMQPYREYLDIDFITTARAWDCVAVQPGLVDVGLIGSQTFTALFEATVGPESTLLFEAQTGFNPSRGLGVIAVPPGGGEFNPDGGQFAFLSGRPYRWDHDDLRSNVEHILLEYFEKPSVGVDAGSSAGLRFSLSEAGPNPFSEVTALRFSLPAASDARIVIWDVNGREVRTLLDGPVDAGHHATTWDGTDGSGSIVPSGVYFYQLEAGENSATRRVLRVR